MALPAVTEKRHARFGLPTWQVRGRTFLGMGPDKTLATFGVTEESAVASAAARPEYSRVVHRLAARRSCRGLEIRLRGASGAHLNLLVLEAWAATAPRKLVRRHLDEGGRLPKPRRTRQVRWSTASDRETTG